MVLKAVKIDNLDMQIAESKIGSFIVFVEEGDLEIVKQAVNANAEISLLRRDFNGDLKLFETSVPELKFLLETLHYVRCYAYISGDNEISFFNDFTNDLAVGNIEVTYPIDTNV